MSQEYIKNSEVDIVIGALQADLSSFLNEWRSIISRFHLIIVQDPDLKGELNIPEGFDLNVYTKSDIDRIVGSSGSTFFSGYSCRYFGYLISRKKYIISIDDDCFPAKDNMGNLIDAVAQHITNLTTPATPFFFNTLYDPFREGADFVRGYPFSLRSGVTSAMSCGLWLNLADYDAPTQALKSQLRNSRYVDAVITVPARALMPISGINIAFDREAVGPTLFPALKLAREGNFRWETMEDIWSGMCAKVVCDHLGLGVKSGLPYVWRKERGSAIDSLRKEWEGVKLMEEVVPFFQSVRLPQTATTAEDCVVEIAKTVKEQLGRVDPVFSRAAEAMVEWVKLWKKIGSGSSPANLNLKSAKLVAVWKSIIFSRDCGLHPCAFELDVACVVKWIEKGGHRELDHGLILDDIDSNVDNIGEVVFCHDDRAANKVARGLANIALDSNEDTFWKKNFPSCVRKMVEADMPT